MEHLNPRAARVVALTKPTETELGQWYFHRYVAQLPTAGEIVFFDRWDAYTAAKEAMIEYTDTDHAPWTSIKSNDKKRARINTMRFFLSQFEYAGKDPSVVYPADPQLVQRGRDSIND